MRLRPSSLVRSLLVLLVLCPAARDIAAQTAETRVQQLSEAFWEKASIVDTRPRRKASVHLRLDPDTLSFYRSAGRGHLTRMANILKAYAETQAQSKHR